LNFDMLLSVGSAGTNLFYDSSANLKTEIFLKDLKYLWIVTGFEDESTSKFKLDCVAEQLQHRTATTLDAVATEIGSMNEAID
jgi:hypothetical protein